jgi:hypothetical protein
MPSLLVTMTGTDALKRPSHFGTRVKIKWSSPVRSMHFEALLRSVYREGTVQVPGFRNAVCDRARARVAANV